MRKIFKKLIAPAMAIIGVLAVLTACNKNNSMNYENENTKVFKEVLNLVEENRANKRGYNVSFVQDFNYDEKKELENEISNYKAHYYSQGSFLLSYEGKNINIEKGIDGFIKEGSGFISGVQTEKHEIINEETTKDTKELIRKEVINHGVDNSFIYDTDANNVSIMSETKYIDYSDRSKDIDDKFYGTIAKDTLMDTIDAANLKTAIDQLMFIDVWDSVNVLIELMHNTFVDLNSKGYEDIYKYLENKNFSFERKDDIISIKYTIDVDDSLKATTENKFNDVEIQFEIDTETKDISYFKFDLSKYFASLFASENDEKTVTSKVNNYYIEGKFLNKPINRTTTSNSLYTKYDEETKYDFVDDFMAYALPIKEDFNKEGE